MAEPWESLAGLNGAAERCSCSDAQLSLVGCDCAAGQNMPIQCACGEFLRDRVEIADRMCSGCAMGGDPPESEPEIWLGPEFADDVSLEERWEHYAFEERNGMPYGSSF